MRSSMPLSEILRPNLPMLIAIGTLAVAGMCAQAANLEEVTVTAATVRTLGRDATGTPIQQVTATARVQYSPIMLTTNSGRALLDDKVAEVARRLCTAGGRVSNTDDDAACVRQAINDANLQLNAAAAAQMQFDAHQIKGQ